jgi:GNAT superfamily N-acetyltransferase
MSALITFHVERWSQYYPDCLDLWAEHYDEIAADKVRQAMSPDVKFYEVCDNAGVLSILTARHKGKMIGYFISVLRRHTHYDTYCAFEDAYFMSREYRKGFAGVRLIKEAEKVLKRRGVQKIFVMTKGFKNLGAIFERLGYGLTDLTYAKWIGE